MELGIGFVAYSAFGKGYLTGRFNENTALDSSDFPGNAKNENCSPEGVGFEPTSDFRRCRFSS